MSGAFDLLARPVQKWVRAQGWAELRDIQVRSIQQIYRGSGDVIVAASTAGGKTEAAFLPLISQVLDDPADVPGFDLLYIGPLKALITDQAGRLEDICQAGELPVVPWHGDVSASVKSRAVKAPRGILLITPESLEAMFVRRRTDIARLFAATRCVVIDELHTMLDSERGVQLRSLLARLEDATGRKLRRVGLSATLGDMDLARRYLNPDHPEDVHLVQSAGGEAELRLQLRGYVEGEKDQGTAAMMDAVAAHLFRHLRGSDNLIFAGARQSVELYADRLRAMCEAAHLPQEFYPHHANLSRDHRSFVETRLKDAGKPTTAVCTSTLELGIDIGDVASVAQVGAPFSVAALRQRLGRSGRRAGQAAILRQYCIESRLTANSNLVDRLRLRLVRAIAMIELLLDGWCEPPRPASLHLSTLVHQILSVIAGQGGARAGQLYDLLCRKGPFRQVSTPMFLDVLRAIGSPEAALIEQSSDGLLLLGPRGEKLVEHYSFYAVFPTPEEYRVIAAGRDLGTLPVDNILSPGMMLIFSGRRWVVRSIEARERVIVVDPATGGAPPMFGGDPGVIHDRVIQKMTAIFTGADVPAYLDAQARTLLEEARGNYRLMGLYPGAVLATEQGAHLLHTGCGSVLNTTLALALRAHGADVDIYDGFLVVSALPSGRDLPDILADLAKGAPADLFTDPLHLTFEPYHMYLSPDLLRLDALSCRLAADDLPGLCAGLIARDRPSPRAPARVTRAGDLPSGTFRFIAVDVETANGDCASICQIGLACVGFDNAINVWSAYVNPRMAFAPANIRLHGIGPAQVAGAPDFATIVRALAPLLQAHPLVQHSGFDQRAFHAAFTAAGQAPPPWRWHDSVRIARAAWPEFRGNGGHGLGHLKDRLGLQFSHHDAGEDAYAAAMVVLRAEEHTGRGFPGL